MTQGPTTPSLKCVSPGMPNAILNPYPIELIDQGDRIIQRIEEWGQQRVFHMSEEARSQSQAPSHLGYSVRALGGGIRSSSTRHELPGRSSTLTARR